MRIANPTKGESHASAEEPRWMLKGDQPERAIAGAAKIRWHTNRETRYPFGDRSADPEWFEPIGFPPPWPERPWIYGVVVASANGVLAWRRASPDDDPVLAVLGDPSRPERIADSRHLRHLRCFGDVGLGAQTVRDQPRLVPTPQELGDPPVLSLYRFRETHGLPHHPRAIIYSLHGRLELTGPLFNTPGMEVIVVGTAARRRGTRGSRRPDGQRGRHRRTRARAGGASARARAPVRRAGRSLPRVRGGRENSPSPSGRRAPRRGIRHDHGPGHR